MKIHIETERLILRDLCKEDAEGIYELDSDPKVHTFLGKKPIKTLNEAIAIVEFINLQYRENGIGRWAVIEKETERFIGWSGFKFITDPINGRSNYYDLGYRFLRRFWGKGFASESAQACLNYGFYKMNQKALFAMADKNNLASTRILEKIGMSKIDEFQYEAVSHNFYQLKKIEWENSTAANNI
ncbi:GNAT family N-acetyltransferase [Salinimicrobium sediminilitoris]|uniref:GNAT family N-acetyltransferase n=1 Tax=Salinimicrobium sediminilitoris TaxID=2876715 RepID=UPI001E58D9F7|nr:GNAT family N-acetyltransferase [Salinimicrobium sediminilitoris]MCC8358928.1 GNAT family N-acetyltransferase [Salinimicrobium sediminilitoris]